MRPKQRDEMAEAARAVRAEERACAGARCAAGASPHGEDAPLRGGMNAARAPPGRGAARAPRRWVWRAEYLDGSVLEELDARGVGARFEDIQRGQLARFGLVETASRREVLGFDCATGVFSVRGRRLDFRLGDLWLTGREGASYREVIQYKSAHADWWPGSGPSRTLIDAHHLGYRAALPEVVFRVLLRLDAWDERVGITAHLAPRGPLPQGAGFMVLVNGARVESEAAFAAALRPARAAQLASGPEVG